jgi:hypothetical protein
VERYAKTIAGYKERDGDISRSADNIAFESDIRDGRRDQDGGS